MSKRLYCRSKLLSPLFKKKSALFALVLTGLSGCANQTMDTANRVVADTVFKNGKVYTVNPANDVVEAVAIKDGKIIALGSDDSVASRIDASTRVIDLQGKMLMPGLIDAHIHPSGGGRFLSACSLDYKPLTVDQILSKLTSCLDNMKDEPADRWLQAGAWFRQATLPEGADLSAAILDQLPTERPVIVLSSSGHSMAANSAAIRAAGITRDTPNPSDGSIVRDANGDATGILIDGGSAAFFAAIPKLSKAEQEVKMVKDLEIAVDAMHAQGITTIFDAGAEDEMLPRAFETLRRAGTLDLRAFLSIFVDPIQAEKPADVVANVKGLASKFNTPVLPQSSSITFESIKIAVDGVIQAPGHSGAMLAPYLHNVGSDNKPNWQPSDNAGPLYVAEPVLTGLLDALAVNGLQAHMHTTGDRAINVTLNAIESVRNKHNVPDFHPALAHDEVVDPADFARFAELDAIPVLSLQWGKPAPDTIDSVEDYMGPERFRYVETAGKFHEAGARIAFGSDWPVDGLNEWLAMQIAITRENPDQSNQKYQGRLGDDPGLDIDTAIRAFTINPAYYLNMDDKVGSLEVGKYADMIVIDRDITAVDPKQIGDTNVLLTVFGGREVYRHPSFK